MEADRRITDDPLLLAFPCSARSNSAVSWARGRTPALRWYHPRRSRAVYTPVDEVYRPVQSGLSGTV